MEGHMGFGTPIQQANCAGLFFWAMMKRNRAKNGDTSPKASQSTKRWNDLEAQTRLYFLHP